MAGSELLPGNKLFTKKLDEIALRSADLVPAFLICEKAFHEHEKKKWADEGPGWEPLQDSTIIRKQGLSDEMMVRGEPGHTEGLKQSLTSRTSHSVYTVTPLEMTVGTNVSYAHFHQYGDGDRMVARPIIDDVTTVRGLAMVNGWLRIIQVYVVNGLAAATALGAAASQA